MNNLSIAVNKFFANFFVDLADFYLNNLWLLNFLGFIISAVLVWLVVFYAIKLNIIDEKIAAVEMRYFGLRDFGKRYSIKAWKTIIKRLKTRDEEQIKIALTEADKILDEVLKAGAYSGDNIEERLAQVTPEKISNSQELLEAHKIAVKAGEEDFRITPHEAYEVLKVYERTFKEFGLIE